MARLREHHWIQVLSKGLTHDVVKHWYDRNPKFEFEHWQQLLQPPVIKYLQNLKHEYDGKIDNLAPPCAARHQRYLWWDVLEH